MKPAGKAWIGLAAGVLAYDILCPQGETLSEGVDRGMENHRLLTLAAIGGVTLHLANLIPQRFDLLSMGFLALKRVGVGDGTNTL